jgi:hypothetical protein
MSNNLGAAEDEFAELSISVPRPMVSKIAELYIAPISESLDVVRKSFDIQNTLSELVAKANDWEIVRRCLIFIAENNLRRELAFNISDRMQGNSNYTQVQCDIVQLALMKQHPEDTVKILDSPAAKEA